jgi:hypothetical protein
LKLGQGIVLAAIKIQRLFRHNFDKSWVALSRTLLGDRSKVKCSLLVNQEMRPFFSQNNLYRNPGINIKSSEFQSILQQSVIVCPAESMEIIDYQLLGLVLKNPYCRLRSLIIAKCYLLTNDNFPCSNSSTDNDVFAGSINRRVALSELDALKQFFECLSKCTSIRSLFILGGKWSSSSVDNVFKLIQVHNPRIRSFGMEKLENASQVSQRISLCCSSLLKDYFNYSIPGISSLSLHGSNLRDEDLIAISEGLSVNTSLEKLIISLNLITDVGFILLLESLRSTSNLRFLDFQFNFIRCQTKARSSLASYRMNNVKFQLEIDLRNNPVLDGFDPIEFSVQTKIPPQLIILYDEIALMKQIKEREELMQHYRKELSKPSSRRLLSVLPPTASSAHISSSEKSLVPHSSVLSVAHSNSIYYETEAFLNRLNNSVSAEGNRERISSRKTTKIMNKYSHSLPPIKLLRASSSENIQYSQPKTKHLNIKERRHF